MKSVKVFRAQSQYKAPDERANLETSYSATYRGCQGSQQPDDNKGLDRRRIRTLYHEPYRESSKVRVCVEVKKNYTVLGLEVEHYGLRSCCRRLEISYCV